MKAYASKFSYFNNENLSLMVNSVTNLKEVCIYRFCDLSIVLSKAVDIDCSQKNASNSKIKYFDGFGWEESLSIPLNKMSSGLFFVKLINEKGDTYFLPLIIKNKGKKRKNLVLLNSFTWNAYNTAGGASFYRYTLTKATKFGPRNAFLKNRPKASVGLSRFRPFDSLSFDIKKYINDKGVIGPLYNHLLYGELRLLKFMLDKEIDFDLIDDKDLHEGWVDLPAYERLVLNCHPEYWTDLMTDRVSSSANNIVSLAGNVAYRTTTIDNNEIIHGIKQPARISQKLKNITGSYYTPAGANTYASYKILHKSVIFDSIKGPVFGEKNWNKPQGSSDDGICGHETDKKIRSLREKILARGGNPNNGGGDILFYEIEKEGSKELRKILSVGSIVFTGGLYVDKEIDNFVEAIFKNGFV